MFQNARAERLLLLIKPFVSVVASSSPSPWCFRKVPNSTGTRAYFCVSRSATCELGSTQV